MYCSTSKNPSQLFFNSLLHILILLLVLTILFMTYVSKIMSQVFTSEIKHGISQAFENVQVPIEYKLVLRKLTLQSFEQEDPVKRVNNMWVNRLMIGILCLLIIMIVAVVYTVYISCKSIDFKQIMIENGITFLLVGTVEFLFFFFIVRNYIPIQPSMMKSYVLSHI